MKEDNDFKGPLVGLNVLDFGHYYAGPAVGLLLADQGANVIRIVKPGEKELPEQQYRLFNRNKKLLTLDLKTADGIAQALALIEKADVLIENFRPGVMQRLGLDYASVKARNPGLVYLSLPGFASTDKKRAHIQAWEGILSAAMGIYVDYSLVRRHLGYSPLYTPFPHCSMYGGTHGAVAVMAALLARDKHGFGTLIEVPLVDAGLSSCTTSFTRRVFGEDGFKAQLQSDAMQKQYGFDPNDSPAERCEKLGKAYRACQPPHLRSQKTADGRKMFAVGAGLWYGPQAYYQLLGLDRQLKQEGFAFDNSYWPDAQVDSALVGFISESRAHRLDQLTQEVFSKKSQSEWEQIIWNQISATVRTRDEFMGLEPMLESGVLTKMDNGQSELTVPGRLCDISGPDDTLMAGFCEAQVIDTAAAERFFGAEKRPRPEGTAPAQKKGDLLRGIKVLDMANVMAVPMSGYILAQYGADVITSVDPRKSIFCVNIQDVLEAGMGKRSILVDGTTAPGLEVIYRMVEEADIVISNILDHTAKRLGVAAGQLHRVNPNVIACQASAWGGSFRGGWENRRGIDDTILTETGIVERFSSLEWPQAFGLGSVVDSMAATAMAFTALLGVWQRQKTGYAGEARTSLVRGNSYFQLPWMIAENGNADWGEVRGQSALGESWHQRLYQCRDNWIYVGTAADQSAGLHETVLGQASTGQADEKALERAFLQHDRDTWLARLDNAGIACHAVLSIEDLRRNPRPVDNSESDETANGALEVLCWQQHPGGVPVTLPAPAWVRVGEEQSYLRRTPSPRRGQHSREIMAELGYAEADINELIALGVVHEYLPELGSKDVYYYDFGKGEHDNNQ